MRFDETEEKKLGAGNERDSNSRPQPWQGCALPTELFTNIIQCLMCILFLKTF